MMNYLEIALISAAIRTYEESESSFVMPVDAERIKTVIATAVIAYLDTENATN